MRASSMLMCASSKLSQEVSIERRAEKVTLMFFVLFDGFAYEGGSIPLSREQELCMIDGGNDKRKKALLMGAGPFFRSGWRVWFRCAARCARAWCHPWLRVRRGCRWCRRGQDARGCAGSLFRGPVCRSWRWPSKRPSSSGA